MPSLKYSVLTAGIAMFVIGVGILTHEVCHLLADRRQCQRQRSQADPGRGALCPETPHTASAVAPTAQWRTSIALVMLAWAPILISAGLVIVSQRSLCALIDLQLQIEPRR
jgi:hypothetical protein